MAESLFDGRFVLERELGAGGFGVVHQATEVGSGRKLAIKVFRPGPGNTGADAVERFKREGKTSARVVHENAITVFEHGVAADKTPFIVMELLSGHTLREELKLQLRLPFQRVLAILEKVCEALAAAHALDVIHRDIKPDNVFLHREPDQREVIKVLDFGVAKALDQPATMPLTITGTVLGTPYYLAPERILGNDYDGRSDVYSVGVMMYQLLCGHLPYGSDNVYSAVMAHVDNPVPEVPPAITDVPAAVSELVQIAMVKDPKERPTASAFAQRLRHLQRP